MKQFILFAIIASLAPSYAYASRWVTYLTNDEFTMSLDMDSISRDNQHLKVWTKTHYNKPQKIKPDEAVNSLEYIEVFDLIFYDCNSRMTTDGVRDIYYNQEGEVVYSGSWAKKFSDVIPDTPREDALILVCKSGK